MLLKEEITRIKEMMGLRILNEQIGRLIKDYIEKAAKNISNGSPDLISNTETIIKKAGGNIEYNKIENMFDQIYKGTKSIEDYPEIDWYKFVDELINTEGLENAKSMFYITLSKDPRVIGLENRVRSVKQLIDSARRMASPEFNEKVNKVIKDLNELVNDVFGDDPELVKLIKKQVGLSDIEKIETPSQTVKTVAQDTKKAVDNVTSQVSSSATATWKPEVQSQSKGGFKIFATTNGLQGIGRESSFEDMKNIIGLDTTLYLDPRGTPRGVSEYIAGDNKVFIYGNNASMSDQFGRVGGYTITLIYPKDTKLTIDDVRPALEAKNKEIENFLETNNSPTTSELRNNIKNDEVQNMKWK